VGRGDEEEMKRDRCSLFVYVSDHLSDRGQVFYEQGSRGCCLMIGSFILHYSVTRG
jgi:hypothetical protein